MSREARLEELKHISKALREYANRMPINTDKEVDDYFVVQSIIKKVSRDIDWENTMIAKEKGQIA